MVDLNKSMTSLWQNISEVTKVQKVLQGSLNNYSSLSPAYESGLEMQKDLKSGVDPMEVDPFGVFAPGKRDPNEKLQEPTPEKREILNQMSEALENDISPVLTQISSKLDLSISESVDLGKGIALAIEDGDIFIELQRIKDSKLENETVTALSSKESVKLLSGLFLLLDKVTTLQTTLSEIQDSANEDIARVSLENEIKKLDKQLETQLESVNQSFNKVWKHTSANTKRIFIKSLQKMTRLFFEFLESRDLLLPVSKDEN